MCRTPYSKLCTRELQCSLCPCKGVTTKRVVCRDACDDIVNMLPVISVLLLLVYSTTVFSDEPIQKSE